VGLNSKKMADKKSSQHRTMAVDISIGSADLVRFFVVSILLALLFSCSRALVASVRFNHAFAPQNGKVAAPERPYRDEICLNGTWQFQPLATPSSFHQNVGPAPDLPAPDPNGWDATPIRVPSPWNVNAFPDKENLGGDFRTFPSYPRSWEDVQMGWLHRKFDVPASWKGRRLFLHFDAVAGNAQVVVNGTTVGNHFDIFLPFDVDVTDAVKYGADNDLLVGVRKASLFDIQSKYGRRTYQGGSMWGQAIAGIWQDVFLESAPSVHIADVFIKPQVDKDVLSADVTLRNDTPADVTVNVSNAVYPWINRSGTDEISAPEPKWSLGARAAVESSAVSTVVPAGGESVVTLSAAVKNRLKLWSPKSPNLYGMICRVTDTGSKITDVKYTRFGWRQITFQGTKTLLNGAPLVMHGDSWHFIGIPEMSRRYAWAWFTTLKKANLNAVRLHAEPYPSFFLDVADEQGILVLDEDAVWASDGGPNIESPAFWTDTQSNLEGLIFRDRNHPSVFGWSVSNELMAVVRNVYHAPQENQDQVIRYDGIWAALCRKDDPTRLWISADGEDDGGGALPTSVLHYAGGGDMQRTSTLGKPWGVGEAGPAYYGTPTQIDQMSSDDNAYNTVLDRMAGVAVTSYQNLADQNKYGADYRSVFNLVWYGLKPLNLGMPDITRPPVLTDGISFPPFVEGEPGVQPERIGPYSTTLNPGYDPSLPLYDPWPLFNAISDAAAEPPIEYKPDRPFKADSGAAGDPHPGSLKSVLVLAAANGTLAQSLTDSGVSVSMGDTVDRSLVFVDGDSPPTASAAPIIQKTLGNGGTVFVWGATPASLASLNTLLPFNLELTNRSASSLIAPVADPITASLTPASLYFSETNPSDILKEGLAGPFVKHAVTLLAATDVDWKRWNGRAELIKTASVLRSEREAKPSGVALSSLSVGKGRIVVCVVPATAESTKGARLNRTLLANLGLNLSGKATANYLFDSEGNILSALACGPFESRSVGDALALAAINPRQSGKIVAGTSINGRTWTKITATGRGSLDFIAVNKSPAAAVYLSFWIDSPKSLNNLLLDPHLPELDLIVGTAAAGEVWLNESPVATETKGDGVVARGLLLQQGWNHILVKAVRTAASAGAGPMLKLQSSQPDYLSELRGDQDVP
jgi:beta-galactosidase